MDCSHRHLNDIPPNLPANTEHLFLDNNNISKVGSHAFLGCSQLKSLYLSDNKLVEIAEEAFNGLHQLEKLLLQKNTRKELQFPIDAFKESTELRVLNIRQVDALSKESDFRRLLGNLTKLQTLIISISPHNWRDILDTISSKLVQLEELHAYCFKIQLGNYTFHKFLNSRIKILRMECVVEGPDFSRYSNFPHLETLDLSCGRYSDPQDIVPFWRGLAKTDISCSRENIYGTNKIRRMFLLWSERDSPKTTDP